MLGSFEAEKVEKMFQVKPKGGAELIAWRCLLEVRAILTEQVMFEPMESCVQVLEKLGHRIEPLEQPIWLICAGKR